jgi:hypothetical protein
MVAYLGVVYEYESILVILIDVILLINMKFTSNIINGWQQHEGDSGVDVISAWSYNDDSYPLAILLFSIKVVYNSVKVLFLNYCPSYIYHLSY